MSKRNNKFGFSSFTVPQPKGSRDIFATTRATTTAIISTDHFHDYHPQISHHESKYQNSGVVTDSPICSPISSGINTDDLNLAKRNSISKGTRVSETSLHYDKTRHTTMLFNISNRKTVDGMSYSIRPPPPYPYYPQPHIFFPVAQTNIPKNRDFIDIQQCACPNEIYMEEPSSNFKGNGERNLFENPFNLNSAGFQNIISNPFLLKTQTIPDYQLTQANPYDTQFETEYNFLKTPTSINFPSNESHPVSTKFITAYNSLKTLINPIFLKNKINLDFPKFGPGFEYLQMKNFSSPLTSTNPSLLQIETSPGNLKFETIYDILQNIINSIFLRTDVDFTFLRKRIDLDDPQIKTICNFLLTKIDPSFLQSGTNPNNLQFVADFDYLKTKIFSSSQRESTNNPNSPQSEINFDSSQYKTNSDSSQYETNSDSPQSETDENSPRSETISNSPQIETDCDFLQTINPSLSRRETSLSSPQTNPDSPKRKTVFYSRQNEINPNSLQNENNSNSLQFEVDSDFSQPVMSPSSPMMGINPNSPQFETNFDSLQTLNLSSPQNKTILSLCANFSSLQRKTKYNFLQTATNPKSPQTQDNSNSHQILLDPLQNINEMYFDKEHFLTLSVTDKILLNDFDDICSIIYEKESSSPSYLETDIIPNTSQTQFDPRITLDTPSPIIYEEMVIDLTNDDSNDNSAVFYEQETPNFSHKETEVNSNTSQIQFSLTIPPNNQPDEIHKRRVIYLTDDDLDDIDIFEHESAIPSTQQPPIHPNMSEIQTNHNILQQIHVKETSTERLPYLSDSQSDRVVQDFENFQSLTLEQDTNNPSIQNEDQNNPHISQLLNNGSVVLSVYRGIIFMKEMHDLSEKYGDLFDNLGNINYVSCEHVPDISSTRVGINSRIQQTQFNTRISQHNYEIDMIRRYLKSPKHLFEYPNHIKFQLFGDNTAGSEIKATEHSEVSTNEFSDSYNIQLSNFTLPFLPEDDALENVPMRYDNFEIPGTSTVTSPIPIAGRRHSGTQKFSFSPFQVRILGAEFETNHYLTKERRQRLSISLNITENQVKTWFQNRRMKVKRQAGKKIQRKNYHPNF